MGEKEKQEEGRKLIIAQIVCNSNIATTAATKIEPQMETSRTLATYFTGELFISSFSLYSILILKQEQNAH